MNKKFRLLVNVILLFVSALMISFLSSCGGKNKSNVIVEQIKPVPEAVLPFLDSYTSGVIAEGEPVKVSFKNVEDLKLKYGEALPSKLFAFTPELKGKAVWLDERTIGFQYDKINEKQQYVGVFNIAEILDVASDLTLEFGFAVRHQNISLISVVPVCNSSEKMGYQLRVAFSNPVDSEAVMLVLDNDFVKKYNPIVTNVGNNVFDVEIADIERSRNESKIQFVLDGKALDCDAKIVRELVIYAQDDFSPIQFEF